MVKMTKNTDWECNNLTTDCPTAGECCMYYGVLADPTGTTAEIALGDSYKV